MQATTHVSLKGVLRLEILERNPIILEKDNEEKTELYSISDFGGIKKNAPFDKWYLSGTLGGTPVFQDLEFEQFYIDEQEKENQKDQEEKSALVDTL